MFHKKSLFFFFLIFLTFTLIFFLLKNENDFPLLQNDKNVELAIYINEEETNAIPSKESGYYYDREKSSCTNGAYINWDSITWSPVVNNISEYKTRCELHFTTTYTEGILNGTDPVLKDELVPITIDNDGTVKKANLESEWYSYANKEWANAVILEDQYDSLNTQGKVNGATKEDGYVSFDGVDDYIDLGLENYDFGTEVTLQLKFKILSTEDSMGHIVLGNLEPQGVSVDYPHNNLRVAYYLEGDNDYTRVNIPEGLELNKIYLLSTTYDGNTIKLYIDGELVGQAAVEGNKKLKISSQSFLLGAQADSEGEHYFFSNMDCYQVAIYNRVLSEEEIKETSKENIKVKDNTKLLKYIDFTNKSYEENEIIPESAIESYFVWIPKYRYQLWDLGLYNSLTTVDESKVHEIPVIFGDYNTSDNVSGECTTPMESGATGNCQIGDYMTHPAFLSIPSTGFWVGKFETGYNGVNSTAEAEQNVNDSSKVIIKPNVYSWRNVQVANAFYTSYDYQRNLDSHMMKNIEWGAVAYLQHSVYGSQESVRINNNSDFITGYQANNEPTCGYSGTSEECNRYCNDNTCNASYPNSILASCTGNITGIYDMSGGVWEYVMGVIVDEEGNPISGRNSLHNSGFNGTFSCPTCDGDTSNFLELTDGYNWPSQKYYEKYIYNTSTSYNQRRILGDATGEMGPFNNSSFMSQTVQISSWYIARGGFIWVNNPWFIRGGNLSDGTGADIFAFDGEYGSVHNYIGFRIILTPTRGDS